MVKKIVIILTLAALPILLMSTSVFSYYGMPETYSGRDVYGLGMGGTGIGNLLRPNTSLKNASLACQSHYTMFSTGVNFGSINTKDTNSPTSFNGDFSYLPFFNISVPIYKNRIGLNYQSVANGKFTSESDNDSAESSFSEIRKADNSIYQVDLFYAYKFEKINLGLAANYLFGHKVDYVKVEFDDANMINPKYEIEQSFKNPGFTVSFSKLINPNFSIGGAICTPIKLEGKQNYKTVTINEQVSSDTFEMPLRTSFGMAYKFDNHLAIAADIDYDMWSQSDAYNNANDTYRIALGGEYQGDKSSNKKFKKISQRIGGAYQTMPLNSIQNNSHELSETSLTYGLSVPVKSSEARIDFAVKYFNRSSNQTDYKENGIMFSIGTNGFDIFKKPLNRKDHREIPKPDDIGLYK